MRGSWVCSNVKTALNSSEDVVCCLGEIEDACAMSLAEVGYKRLRAGHCSPAVVWYNYLGTYNGIHTVNRTECGCIHSR